MKDTKLEIRAITDKIDIEDVEVQDNDPCKDIWAGIKDCLYDCANQTPRASIFY